MYRKVKSCVKPLNIYSDYFGCAIGLSQGENMSPIMFSLLIKDLELFLQEDLNSGLLIDNVVLILLLFADDVAILAKSPRRYKTS